MNDFQIELLTLLNDELFINTVNPVIKYCLISLFDNNFKRRSPKFTEALSQWFNSINNYVDISAINLESIHKRDTIQDTKLSDDSLFNSTTEKCSDLTVRVNLDLIEKDQNYNKLDVDNNAECLNTFLNNEWEWAAEHLLTYCNDYILDLPETNSLVDLIKEYIFSKEDPKNSKLLICYNLVSTSIELAFCLQLLLQFPLLIMHNKEKDIYLESQYQIKYRISKFVAQWKKLYGYKLDKSPLLRKYMNMYMIQDEEDDLSNGHIDLIEMTKEEPLLKKNFISFSRLIQDGVFLFDVEEIAKQLCIIDQTNIAELSLESLIKYIKSEESTLFNHIQLREKQFKAYILFFIFLITCIQVRKTVIEKFIELAYVLKKKQNYQSYFTIIKTFQFINLKDKVSLWDQLDNEYKSQYLNMVNEINGIEMNDGLILFKNKKNSLTLNQNLSSNELGTSVLSSIPNVYSLCNTIEIIKRRANKQNQEDQFDACNEFKDFYLAISEIKRNKFPYYENNPLFDFLKFGFKEIFRTNIWKPQFKKYSLLRPLIEDINKIDKILEHLDEKFKKIDAK